MEGEDENITPTTCASWCSAQNIRKKDSLEGENLEYYVGAPFHFVYPSCCEWKPV